MKKGALSGVNGGDTQFNLPNTPAFVLVGTTDLDLVLTKLAVQVGGSPTQNVQDQTHIQALSKFLMEGLLGADVKAGQILKIADGFLDKACTITMTQTGVTTPEVKVFSDGVGDSPVVVSQETIQASSSLIFDNFDALIFSATNFDEVDLIFADGHPDTLLADEVAALFAMDNQCDADGKLAGLLVIDNKDGEISSAEIKTTSGGTLLVTSVNL